MTLFGVGSSSGGTLALIHCILFTAGGDVCVAIFEDGYLPNCEVCEEWNMSAEGVGEVKGTELDEDGADYFDCFKFDG